MSSTTVIRCDRLSVPHHGLYLSLSSLCISHGAVRVLSQGRDPGHLPAGCSDQRTRPHSGCVPTDRAVPAHVADRFRHRSRSPVQVG